MEHPRLETAVLRDIDCTWYYGAECRSCHHAARLSIDKLKEYLGPAFAIRDIRTRLKCEICGSREAVICFLGPHQRTGSLAYLFHKKPRV